MPGASGPGNPPAHSACQPSLQAARSSPSACHSAAGLAKPTQPTPTVPYGVLVRPPCLFFSQQPRALILMGKPDHTAPCPSAGPPRPGGVRPGHPPSSFVPVPPYCAGRGGSLRLSERTCYKVNQRLPLAPSPGTASACMGQATGPVPAGRRDLLGCLGFLLSEGSIGLRLEACTQPTASQLTRLGWDLCIPPRTPGKASQMALGCICLVGFQAGTVANAHCALGPAHAWPQIHCSDLASPPPTALGPLFLGYHRI